MLPNVTKEGIILLAPADQHSLGEPKEKGRGEPEASEDTGERLHLGLSASAQPAALSGDTPSWGRIPHQVGPLCLDSHSSP